MKRSDLVSVLAHSSSWDGLMKARHLLTVTNTTVFFSSPLYMYMLATAPTFCASPTSYICCLAPDVSP